MGWSQILFWSVIAAVGCFFICLYATGFVTLGEAIEFVSCWFLLDDVTFILDWGTLSVLEAYGLVSPLPWVVLSNELENMFSSSDFLSVDT